MFDRLGPWTIVVGAVLGGGGGMALWWWTTRRAARATPPDAENAAPSVGPGVPDVPETPAQALASAGVTAPVAPVARPDAPPLAAGADTWLDHAEALLALATGTETLGAGRSAAEAVGIALDQSAAALARGGAVGDSLVRALSLAAAIPAQAHLARAHALLGRHLEVGGDVEGAHGHFLTALDLYEGLNDRAGVAAVCDLLALLHVRLEDPEGAEAYWRYALSLVTALGERQEEARLLGRLGAVALHREAWHAADELLREALLAQESLGNLGAAAGLACDLGRLEEARGQPENALEYWKRAHRMLADLGDGTNEEMTRLCADALARLQQTQPG